MLDHTGTASCRIVKVVWLDSDKRQPAGDEVMTGKVAINGEEVDAVWEMIKADSAVSVFKQRLEII